MTQKLSEISTAVVTTSTVTQTKVEVEGMLSTKFTVFAMAFNVIGLVAVTFGGTGFSGNVPVAELVLGSSMVCLIVSSFRSSFSNIKEKIWS
jgi:hypothetical protein